MLYVLLGRLALADHGLFHLQGRVFGHRQPGMNQRADRRATRLTEQQRRLRIDVDEDLLDGGLIGGIGRDDFADAGEQGLDPFR
mgnify:CR=1 FL=1